MQSNLARKLSGVLLIVSLLLFSIWVARYALADFYYQRSKTAYGQLDISALSYSHELDEVVNDINSSLELRRSAADALDFKANLLYQSWWLSPDGQYLDDSLLLQQALLLHLEALEIRRGWAFSAARLALIHSHQAKLDDNFDQWFTEAHRLGLYETSIARSLMVIGLSNWARLSEQQKSLTIDFARASIEQKANSTAKMTAFLDGYQKRWEVCNSLADTPRKIKVCENL